MTLRLHHPIALEPERAAAHARWRAAQSGQRRRAYRDLKEETTAALRRSMEARDENH